MERDGWCARWDDGISDSGRAHHTGSWIARLYRGSVTIWRRGWQRNLRDQWSCDQSGGAKLHGYERRSRLCRGKDGRRLADNPIMIRRILTSLFVLLALCGVARAQTGCTVQTQAQLLQALRDNA